jgi:hypothetical protein
MKRPNEMLRVERQQSIYSISAGASNSYFQDTLLTRVAYL